jgi:outer membrane lipoprotein SlyB
METANRNGRISPALVWTAGVAIIVFCAAGAAAFMGWLPSSAASPEGIVTEGTKSASKAVAPTRVASVERAEARPARVQKAAAPACTGCGVVESIREVASEGHGSGLGAVGGAVAGGVLGHQVGGGRGQDVATVVGVVGGAFAGNEVEKRMKSSTSYAVTVRLDDGSTRVISESVAPSWRAGDRVKIVDGAIRPIG